MYEICVCRTTKIFPSRSRDVYTPDLFKEKSVNTSRMRQKATVSVFGKGQHGEC